MLLDLYSSQAGERIIHLSKVLPPKVMKLIQLFVHLQKIGGELRTGRGKSRVEFVTIFATNRRLNVCVAVVKRRHVDIREVEGKSSRDQNNDRGTDSEISKQRHSGVARAS